MAAVAARAWYDPAPTMQAPPAPAPPSARALVAVGLLAGASLALQVALTRHFSFLYWHHFAFMIIGVGMLGFGAAGAWLARGGGVNDAGQAVRLASFGSVAAAIATVGYMLVGPAIRLCCYDREWAPRAPPGEERAPCSGCGC